MDPLLSLRTPLSLNISSSQWRLLYLVIPLQTCQDPFSLRRLLLSHQSRRQRLHLLFSRRFAQIYPNRSNVILQSDGQIRSRPNEIREENQMKARSEQPLRTRTTAEEVLLKLRACHLLKLEVIKRVRLLQETPKARRDARVREEAPVAEEEGV